MNVYSTAQIYLKTHGVELAGRIFAALVIVFAALVLARFARSAVRAALDARAGDRRAETLAPAIQSLTRMVILGGGAIMALHQLGLNIATVLAGAGVLGLAVGFGAQTLVRDFISGFFLIADGVVEAGDHITFNDLSGTVERIGLRMTEVRSFDGQLWYVPNGELKIVGNSNRDWCRAVVNVPFPHEQDVTRGLQVVQRVADAWAASNPDIVLEPPEAQGVLSVSAASVDVRVVVKVKPLEHWPAQRKLTHLIKQAFEAEGMELPLPRQVVYHRGEGAPAKPAAS